MDDFDKQFDELLKNALNDDRDADGLTVDEELIASTMKAIDEAAPDREKIRASYDESFKNAPRKSIFTKKNVTAAFGIVAGLAAVAVTVIFIGMGGATYSKSESVSGATMSTSAKTDASAERKTESAADGIARETMEFEIMGANETETVSAPAASAPNSYGIGMTEPAEDGLYYFDDEEIVENESAVTSSLLKEVYTVYDKQLFKPMLEAVSAAATGEPEVVDRRTLVEEPAEAYDVSGSSSSESAADIAYTIGESGDAADFDVAAEEEEEEFDINNPEMLSQALEESKAMLDETGGLPSENAKHVIEFEEYHGEMIPKEEIPYDNNPNWVELGDASDESFEEYAPLIVVYDKDVEADLDICIKVFDDSCILYDFALDTTSTYPITNGRELADKLLEIVSKEKNE
jgi:hypothetical protein